MAEENMGQTFLQNYALSLVDIEDALDDSLGEFWNFTTDPAHLQVPQRIASPPRRLALCLV